MVDVPAPAPRFGRTHDKVPGPAQPNDRLLSGTVKSRQRAHSAQKFIMSPNAAMGGKELFVPDNALPHFEEHVALLGMGVIGVSFLALHLKHTSAHISIFDPRPDLRDHLSSLLPVYLGQVVDIEVLIASGRLCIASSDVEAVKSATIVQEQGPEDVSFKNKAWSRVLQYSSPTARLWSSTSGIPASEQLANIELATEVVEHGQKRLLVVHPFNPPHLMPLIEIVPSKKTAESEVAFAYQYFASLPSKHRPVVIHKEVAGFVANRLSFVLFREACNLVTNGVVSVEELDEIVQTSLGPRWAINGPFYSYALGGGSGGIRTFFDKIGATMAGVWRTVDELKPHHTGKEVAWKPKIIESCEAAFGILTEAAIAERDRKLTKVLRASAELAKVSATLAE